MHRKLLFIFTDDKHVQVFAFPFCTASLGAGQDPAVADPGGAGGLQPPYGLQPPLEQGELEEEKVK